MWYPPEVASRTYQQYCPLAHALDAVGERWSLLIVRELLGGPKRYTDLRNGLGAISPTLLATRLEELEVAGVIERQTLPPPAARAVYALTEDGRSLGPVLGELTRWGMRRLPEPDADAEAGAEQAPRPLMAARAALFAYAQPERLGSESRTYRVDIDGEPFTVAIRESHAELSDGPPPASADLDVTIGAADLIRLRRGTVTAARLAKTDHVRYQPHDRERIREFLTVFSLEPTPPAAR
jgi:DNA-binding HxlR family transcriptional regulator